MSKEAKKPTFRFFVHKDGEQVNIDTLTPEERERVGIWAYQTLVKSLGYAPMEQMNKT